MTPLAAALQATANHLLPHRDALVESWVAALSAVTPAPAPSVRDFCTRVVDTLLSRLARGEVESWLADEALKAEAAAQAGTSLYPFSLAIRVLDRCCLPFLLAACADSESLAECLLALDELGDRRLEILLRAQEHESARRLVDAQDQAARSVEKVGELARLNDALRRSEAQSQHRAEQIGLLSEVARRIARVTEPERVMQDAAEAIQARMNHTYVAVVVLDEEGVLVGRWAGRPGIGRRSSGRAQGPAGGIIGRALRKRAPQVVADVSQDPDYHADVPGTRSEMVIPLLEGGEVVGAMDFQSEKPGAFDLDAVAVGETIAEFLVVSLRNARLLAEARRGHS
jgi:putative methionine-R-sulfoxide reductase with GAF domain